MSESLREDSKFIVAFQRKKKEIVFVQNVKALNSTSYSTLLLPMMQH